MEFGRCSISLTNNWFCGTVFAKASNREVGIDAVRAWNDWLFTEWYSKYPSALSRGITYLGDSDEAVREIRRNAERGFVSVTLPEMPTMLGSLTCGRGFWDPIMEACAETETVISLHVGSSGMAPFAPGSPALQIGATLFGQLSLEHALIGYGVNILSGFKS